MAMPRYAVEPMPAGLVLLADAACPSGYTRVATIDGKFLRSNPTFNAAPGGNATHTHSIGSHTHPRGAATSSQGGDAVNVFSGGSSVARSDHTHSFGAGNTGAAAATGNAQSLSPPNTQIILCQKN